MIKLFRDLTCRNVQTRLLPLSHCKLCIKHAVCFSSSLPLFAGLDPKGRRWPRKPTLVSYQAYIHALSCVADFECSPSPTLPS